MGWDLKQLREDVERLFGREQRDLLSPCLNSIVDRQYYARFHFQEGIRLIKEFIEHRDDQVSLTLLVVGANPQEQEEFCVRRKQAEAHVLACMQSMHALSDTLGHVLYFATGGNLDPKRRLDLWKVSLRSVRPTIKSDPTTAALQQLTTALVDHADYQYLNDVVNYSKHRSVIGTCFKVSMAADAGRPYGLSFRAFEGRNTIHAERWVDAVIEREYVRQASLVIQIGAALNSWAQEKCRNLQSG